jgi:hypothetical protein
MKRVAALLGLAVSLPAWAQAPAAEPPKVDRAEIDRTQIIGHKELPKVLYIVPWKKPLPGELSGRPRVSLLDEVLAPLDRTEFRRQLDYRAQLARGPESQPTAPQEKAK